jgi:hypothetical protein
MVKHSGVTDWSGSMTAGGGADLPRRILAEYREMPGLRLTLAQARRLWAVDAGACRRALEALVARGLLARTAMGEYCARIDLRRPGRPETGAPTMEGGGSR